MEKNHFNSSEGSSDESVDSENFLGSQPLGTSSPSPQVMEKNHFKSSDWSSDESVDSENFLGSQPLGTSSPIPQGDIQTTMIHHIGKRGMVRVSSGKLYEGLIHGIECTTGNLSMADTRGLSKPPCVVEQYYSYVHFAICTVECCYFPPYGRHGDAQRESACGRDTEISSNTIHLIESMNYNKPIVYVPINQPSTSDGGMQQASNNCTIGNGINATLSVGSPSNEVVMAQELQACRVIERAASGSDNFLGASIYNQTASRLIQSSKSTPGWQNVPNYRNIDDPDTSSKTSQGARKKIPNDHQNASRNTRWRRRRGTQFATTAHRREWSRNINYSSRMTGRIAHGVFDFTEIIKHIDQCLYQDLWTALHDSIRQIFDDFVNNYGYRMNHQDDFNGSQQSNTSFMRSGNHENTQVGGTNSTSSPNPRGMVQTEALSDNFNNPQNDNFMSSNGFRSFRGTKGTAFTGLACHGHRFADPSNAMRYQQPNSSFMETARNGVKSTSTGENCSKEMKYGNAQSTSEKQNSQVINRSIFHILETVLSDFIHSIFDGFANYRLHGKKRFENRPQQSKANFMGREGSNSSCQMFGTMPINGQEGSSYHNVVRDVNNSTSFELKHALRSILLHIVEEVLDDTHNLSRRRRNEQPCSFIFFNRTGVTSYSILTNHHRQGLTSALYCFIIPIVERVARSRGHGRSHQHLAGSNLYTNPSSQAGVSPNIDHGVNSSPGVYQYFDRAVHYQITINVEYVIFQIIEEVISNLICEWFRHISMNDHRPRNPDMMRRDNLSTGRGAMNRNGRKNWQTPTQKPKQNYDNTNL